jgi:hypothetical protein
LRIAAWRALLSLHQFLFQPLRLKMCDQRVHEGAELAVHHFGQLMQRESDAVIGDAILRKIVGADFFRAVARLDLAAAIGGDRFVLLGRSICRARRRTRITGAILDLRFSSAGDNLPEGMCGSARRNTWCLPTGRPARQAERVMRRSRLDLDVDVVGLGQHATVAADVWMRPVALQSRERAARGARRAILNLE